ncbi:unnamed protein product [Candidula unifasciata]|uniref:Uncharacterized protein n=1 Tax=Candidula unifasciata TaxID=100452 RepID=A0A8S3Z7V9_9EUPU|nr:unnamed protein product [Candidula unifasciata]
MKRSCNRKNACLNDNQTDPLDTLNCVHSQSITCSFNMKPRASQTTTYNTQRLRQESKARIVSTNKRRHSLATTDAQRNSSAACQTKEMKSILRNAVLSRRSSLENVEITHFSKHDYMTAAVTESQPPHNFINEGVEQAKSFVFDDFNFDQALREKDLLRKCLYRLPAESLSSIQGSPKKVTFKNDVEHIANVVT